ncbi:hypothetical protein [Aeromonas veronii]|uniref:hypothetical protein n=1 Tax=Aeromonas veronii TaxID=654 RepID=UPI0030D42177
MGEILLFLHPAHQNRSHHATPTDQTYFFHIVLPWIAAKETRGDTRNPLSGDACLQAVYRPFKKYALRKMRLSTLRIVAACASRIAQYSVPFAALTGSQSTAQADGEEEGQHQTKRPPFLAVACQ